MNKKFLHKVAIIGGASGVGLANQISDNIPRGVIITDLSKNKPIGQSIEILEDMNVIEINGVKYTEKPKPKTGKTTSKLLMMAIALGVGGNYGSTYNRKRPSVNIVKEFELIQQKKSKLSRNDRDWVEVQFHKIYKEI